MNSSTAVKDEGFEAVSRRWYLVEGMKSAFPIAVGYIPIAIAFGLLSKSSGIPNYISILMSFMVFAGASQFMAVNLISIGISPIEIIAAVFILNLRHFLMSASISQRVEKGSSVKWQALLSFGITDETFTVASLRKERELNRMFLLGLNTLSFASWVCGTAAGIFLGGALPESLQASMGIALYAMFIGLLIPSLRKSKPVLIVTLIAVIFHSLLHYMPVFSNLSSGWGIIISTVIASAAGALLFGEGVNHNE
jgi:4-azaleucine resistance transporter AzlC